MMQPALFPYTTLFRSVDGKVTKVSQQALGAQHTLALTRSVMNDRQTAEFERTKECNFAVCRSFMTERVSASVCCRSEEHTSELQSQSNLVCRLLLEKK